MKKTRYTEEQIAFALRQAESGTPIAGSRVKSEAFVDNLLYLRPNTKGVTEEECP